MGVLSSGDRVRHRSVLGVVAVLAVLGATLVGPLVGVASATATLVVNSTGNKPDANPGDGVCISTIANGSVCSLTAAIQEANALAGVDTINFDATVFPSGTKINVGTGLPSITGPVVIDASANGKVRLDGQTNNPAFGLDLAPGSGGSTVRGLTIVRMQVGILVRSDGDVVAGNVLGMLETSTTSCPSTTGNCANNVGVRITDASNTVVGGTTGADRNVISNNSAYGVEITTSAGSSANNAVRGNYIGTNVAGAAAVANSYGIYQWSSATPPTGTTIGGAVSGAGNVISGNGTGIQIDAGSGTTIAGNTIGLVAAGTTALANTGNGITVSPAHDITIGGGTTAARNVISGNNGYGVYLYEGTGLTPSNVLVQGNYIGTDATGAVDRGNLNQGLRLDYVNGATVSGNLISGNAGSNLGIQGQIAPPLGVGDTVTGNTLGLAVDGATPLGRGAADGYRGIDTNSTIDLVVTGNVVSGNAYEGIALSGDVRPQITNNKIGTNAAGTAGAGNANSGIYGQFLVEPVIGTAGAGNIVAANDDLCSCSFDNHGIYLYGSSDGRIQGNLIGTAIGGTTPLGNLGQGIGLQSSHDFLVGGAAVGEGNVVGASYYEGILLYDTEDSRVVGNKVGVGIDGTTAIGNQNSGIALSSSSDRNVIGGTGAGEANIIRNNGIAGVMLADGVSNLVRGNQLDDNGSLGIDIANNGVTPNDAGDLDSGPNRGQNYPTLSTAASNASGTQVTGNLSSRANRSYDLDFYASPACDASGNGEGAVYLGSSVATTDGSGNASFVANLAGVAPSGNAVTATATDKVTGDTSELSACTTGALIPTVSVSPTAPSVGEGAGTANLTVTLSTAPTLTPVTVAYATATGSAGAGDFTAQSGTLTFGVGETSKPISVPVNSDTLDEDDETFTVTLSNPMNTLIATGGGQSTVTILDDDNPPTISVDDPSAVAETGGATQTFTVSLSAASSKTVTVLVSTNPVSATAGVDYVSRTALVTFNPGTTTQTVDVTVNDDLVDENAETYELVLSTPTNASISDGTGIGTITDDDTWPTVSVAADAATVSESGFAAFTVSLSASSPQTVTVTWQTADGTAGSGDYTQQVPQVLTFAPGETSKPISVPITADSIDEANETFAVTLSSPSNAFLATSSATVTVLDDDATPSLSVSDPSNVTEIPGGVTQTFVVTLSAASGLPVSAVASTVAGTASEGTDYTAVAGALTFAPGTTTQNVVVTVLDDDLDEANESYDVTLSSVVNAGVSDATGTGTIVDDDIYPTITVTPGTQNVSESGLAAFNVNLSQASNLTVTVSWQTTNGTATGGSDFTTQPPTVLTFTPGQTTKPISVPITADTLDEDDETFSITLSTPTHGTVLAGATATITDDDALPSLSFGATPNRTETPGGINQTFTVTLSAPSGRSVSVVASTVSMPGEATPDADYTSRAATLTFAPGETSKAFTVVVLDDLVDEPNQQYQVRLFSPVNATIGTASKTATILDNDALPTISVGDVSHVEGDAGTFLMTFTLSLSAPSERGIQITATTSPGSATTPSDYVHKSSGFTLLAGSTSVTFSVKVKGDVNVEGDEQFVVDLSSPSNVTIADGHAVGTILDDDAPAA